MIQQESPKLRATDYFPRYVWIKCRWMLAVAFFPPVSYLLYGFGSLIWGWDRSVLKVIPFLLTMSVGFGAAALLIRRFDRRLYPRVAESDYCLCTACAYSLRGLVCEDGFVTCPECGKREAIEEIRQRWWYWAFRSRWLARQRAA